MNMLLNAACGSLGLNPAELGKKLIQFEQLARDLARTVEAQVSQINSKLDALQAQQGMLITALNRSESAVVPAGDSWFEETNRSVQNAG